MDAELYIAKHEFIRAYLKDITRDANKGINTETATPIAENINRLNGVLLMHLASEDSFLYPHLLESSDENVRRITREYMNEMGNIAEKYTRFHSAYNTPSKILGDAAGFALQFAQIASVLTTRMNREETELYTF